MEIGTVGTKAERTTSSSQVETKPNVQDRLLKARRDWETTIGWFDVPKGMVPILLNEIEAAALAENPQNPGEYNDYKFIEN